jgi:hypothetical protein
VNCLVRVEDVLEWQARFGDQILERGNVLQSRRLGEEWSRIGD